MNMLERMRLKSVQKRCSPPGWAVLGFSALVNLCVIGYAVIHTVFLYFAELSGGGAPNVDVDRITDTGIGYFIAISIGIAVLMMWKKPRYVRDELLKTGRPMAVKDFFLLLLLFLSPQLVFGYFTNLVELLLNTAGLSIRTGIDSATGQTDSFSMFLYVALGAPIAEELLFRGLVLRSLERYGKKFAIICSALMFGLYHGNLLQIPYAFVVGLVLGYTALEYNIGWAMVLHMFNNLILGDTISRLIPGLGGMTLQAIVIYGCFAAGVVILLSNWQRICKYRKDNVDGWLCYKGFFTSPGVIVLLVYSLFTAIYVLFAMIKPLS